MCEAYSVGCVYDNENKQVVFRHTIEITVSRSPEAPGIGSTFRFRCTHSTHAPWLRRALVGGIVLQVGKCILI
jgi:hypothetical protein